MASLKEVKARIASVNSTLKITSAMRMISSSKLHRAQQAISNLTPYHLALKDILNETLSEGGDFKSKYTEIRPIKRVAIVAVSSNTSLCGAFNVNIEKLLQRAIDEYKSLGMENVIIFPVGKKITKHLKSQGYTIEDVNPSLSDKPDYTESSQLAARLMTLYREGLVDHVEIIYTHFKSMATQIPNREQFLPVITKESDVSQSEYYIFEPDWNHIVTELIEKILYSSIYTILSDSVAAEHAARTVAMQLASDNATKLIQELTVLYNKTRQQEITNELLDILGGSAR